MEHRLIDAAVRVRLLANPYLWCWDIVEAGGPLIESSFDTRSEAFVSSQEARTAGLARLTELVRPARGAAVAGRARSVHTHQEALVIVQREDRALFDSLRRAFQDRPGIAVIRDRRSGERRLGSDEPTLDRRQGDRRSRPEVEVHLRSLGWWIVIPGGVGAGVTAVH